MRSRGGHFWNALQIGTDSEGGYLVPDEYERTLVDALRENRLRTLCKIIRTASGDRKDPAGGLPRFGQLGRGGRHDSRIDDAFGQVPSGAHKIASMIKVSDECRTACLMWEADRHRVRPPLVTQRSGVHQRRRLRQALRPLNDTSGAAAGDRG